MKPSYEYLLYKNGDLEKESLQQQSLIRELMEEVNSLYMVNQTYKLELDKREVS